MRWATEACFSLELLCSVIAHRILFLNKLVVFVFGLTGLSDILQERVGRGTRLLREGRHLQASSRDADVLCSVLINNRDSNAMMGIASSVIETYRSLNADGQRQFFRMLHERYNADESAIAGCASTYIQDRTPGARSDLLRVAEPPRQELFRRLAEAENGAANLVNMRRDLLTRVRDKQVIKSVDKDLSQQIERLFHNQVLTLHPLDARASSHMLALIAASGAAGTSDIHNLYRRLEHPHLRHFVCLHPQFPSEPLVFMEVLLCADVPHTRIDTNELDRFGDQPRARVETLPVAVLQTIRTCKQGLHGLLISRHLVNDLIVALTGTLAHLETFISLSAMPEFCRWLQAMEQMGDHMAKHAGRVVTRPGWQKSDAAVELGKVVLRSLAARYFLQAKTASQQPLDSQARFHLANGAQLQHILWQADNRQRAQAQSFGMMAAYAYNPANIAVNRQGFLQYGQINVSESVRRLLVTVH